MLCSWLLVCALVAVPAAFGQDAAKDLARDVVLDQKQIWTSPFRMTRRNAKWWLIFGAATGALIATDRRSAQQLPNTGDQVAVSRGVSRLGAAYTLAPIAGGFYLSAPAAPTTAHPPGRASSHCG